MAEPDKDLPLAVAEILIEMHGMNGRLTNVEKRLENVDNIQQLSKTVNRTAEVLLTQQQEFNRRFDKQQAKSDQRFEQLRHANREQAERLERAIANIDNRFERLENR